MARLGCSLGYSLVCSLACRFTRRRRAGLQQQAAEENQKGKYVIYRTF